MDDKEITWDRLLKIKTTGRDDTNADQYKYPYEPTPYSVLERLGNSGLIRKKNVLLDYGCGKGRVDFFMSYQTRCTSIGVEYDEHILKSALQNKITAVSGSRVSFESGNAETFTVPDTVDRIFFFNPFSEEILKKTYARILESYYNYPRKILMFFYYPSDEFASFLMQQDELMFYDEIETGDLFPGNDPREKILIFEME